MHYLLMALPVLMGLVLGLLGRLVLVLVLAVTGFITVMALGYWEGGNVPDGAAGAAGMGMLAQFAGAACLATVLGGLAGAGLRRLLRRKSG